MKCKLTQTEGKGINAHIIPKSFYAIDPDEAQPPRLVTNAEGQYAKRLPIGIYDNTIVTEDGERVFTEWDDYASELLINQKSSFEPIKHNSNGEIIFFQIAGYDYIKLKLFFLSVLWRASVSSQHFFRKIDLGSHEPLIRASLLKGDPKDSDWFAISIAKWSDHPDGVGMMDPYHTRFDGINYYVMYLGHYIVYYKVDKRIPDKTLQLIQLKRDAPLIVLGRKLKTSKELKILAGMVKKVSK